MRIQRIITLVLAYSVMFRKDAVRSDVEYQKRFYASISLKEAPPFCVSPDQSQAAATAFFGLPTGHFGVLEDWVAFWGFRNVMYRAGGDRLQSNNARPELLVHSRTNRIAEVVLYPEHWGPGDNVKIDVATAREVALKYAMAHYYKGSLEGMRLMRDGEPRDSQQPYPYRFEWGDTEPLYRWYPKHYCNVYVSTETGDVSEFQQDADDFEPKIPMTPKITKEQALEIAKRTLAMIDIVRSETRQICWIREDDVSEQYLEWEVEIHGSNPDFHPIKDIGPKPFGGIVDLDAMTGEVLSCMGGSWRPATSKPDSFWPENRGIQVAYFGRTLRLYQPPVRRNGVLFLNQGFFPPFLIDVDWDVKHGAVRLKSAKGERKLVTGKQALVINSRLLLPADLLVELSPETVTINEDFRNSIVITWDYEHRRTPYPKPQR